jgi:uncharacterized membrane protein
MEQAPQPTTAGKNTTMAALAYIIFFLPLLTGDAKKDPFVKYHTKQGLVLFLLVVLINILSWIVPFYMWYSLSWILNLGTLALLIIGIMNAVNGKQEPLPLIGSLSDIFKF